MLHVLGIDLLDRPNVDGVVRSKELVSGSFAPTIKRPLMVAHKVFPSQNRMLFHPNDGLGEVQARSAEDWRIVATVGVTAPDVKGPARLESAGQVAEPGPQ